MEIDEVKQRTVPLSDHQLQLLLKAIETAEKNATRSANNCENGKGSAKSVAKQKGYLQLKDEYKVLQGVIFELTKA